MEEKKPQTVVLEEILENIPYFIFWKDRESRFLGANKKFALAAGFKNVKSLIGKDDFDGCWSKEEAEFFRSIDKKVMTENKAILNVEEPQKQLDGTTSTLLTSKVPLHDDEGNVIGILGIYTDITDRKNLEIEKDEAIKKLKEIQEQLIHSEKIRSLGEMAGGIAHEINNPLAAIAGNTTALIRLIQKGKANDELIIERLDRINGIVDRISKITSSLRTLSRSDESDELVPVKINLILDDTLSLCEESLRNLGIPLTVSLPNKLENLSLKCNRITLSQVLLNLINNSKYAVSELSMKWIKIEIEVNDDLYIRVIDSGEGISDEIAKNIFTPFYTTKEIGEGTGIGLSLSKKLIEKQGGKLSYRSENKNTCFEIIIPKVNLADIVA